MKCRDCNWWEKIKNNLHDLRKGYDFDQSFLGFCRRTLPIAVQYTSDKEEIAAGNPQCQYLAHWPETKETDWCGEFEEKKEYKPGPGSHA
jgi:hypothetical protein